MKIVIIGLSITSSWGNGHATTYRGLVRELCRRGHQVLFLERDVPWYASNRDMPCPPFGMTRLYGSNEELMGEYRDQVVEADLVIVGSYVEQGIEVGDWVLATANGLKAFYDIDTPVTLAALERSGESGCRYLSADQVPRYDLYLSFTGGPTLGRLEQQYGSPCARPLYCSVDPEIYQPLDCEPLWDLGYLGTYSRDRQPPLEELMLQAARTWSEGRFVVTGPGYPREIAWPANVERIEHLPPHRHPWFYNAQRFTQNITRADMKQAGYSPSVRLFEAAACGVPIISDDWRGLSELLAPGKEIFISTSAQETLGYLRDIPEQQRRLVGENARRRILSRHTAANRAKELESYVERSTAAALS